MLRDPRAHSASKAGPGKPATSQAAQRCCAHAPRSRRTPSPETSTALRRSAYGGHFPAVCAAAGTAALLHTSERSLAPNLPPHLCAAQMLHRAACGDTNCRTPENADDRDTTTACQAAKAAPPRRGLPGVCAAPRRARPGAAPAAAPCACSNIELLRGWTRSLSQPFTPMLKPHTKSGRVAQERRQCPVGKPINHRACAQAREPASLWCR